MVVAQATWTEVRSPHFRVLTDGSTQEGQTVAAGFEQLRHVFALTFNDQAISSGAPLTILAARNEGTFKMLEPASWKISNGTVAGEFHRGWEKQFATLNLEASNHSVAVFHEYTHSILHARAHWLPVWLDEGMAEFYGYTRFEEKRTLIGTPSQRAGVLRGYLLSINEMLDTRNEAKLIHDASKANLFYAEAWGMVHYMMFGKGMENGVKLNTFFKKIQDGEGEKDAFTEVFGDPRAFDKEFSQYVQGFGFQARVLPADEKIEAKSFPALKLTAAETDYELGNFFIGAHETALGRARIDKALAEDPKLAGPHEELAFLNFRAGKDADALKEWKQAVELDATRSRSVFAVAMMNFSLNAATPEELRATQATLQHVVELAPGFAPGYVELALVEWRLGQIKKAFDDVRRAEILEPWRAGYHILRGHILLAGGQPAGAVDAARFVAERWSGPDHNEAVDLWNEIPAASRGNGDPPVIEMAQGAKVVRGTLTELTCSTGPGVPMTLTLTPDEPGTNPLTFKSDGRFTIGFSDSFWWGEDHFSRCYHLTGHTAIVAYKPEDQHLFELEVRDDLPKTSSAAEKR